MAKNKHNLEVGSSIERSDERIKETQEVFTPQELVESMIDDISVDILKDPESTFLDNSAGIGKLSNGIEKSPVELSYRRTHSQSYALCR
jgi:hypothetical protein